MRKIFFLIMFAHLIGVSQSEKIKGELYCFPNDPKIECEICTGNRDTIVINVVEYDTSYSFTGYSHLFLAFRQINIANDTLILNKCLIGRVFLTRKYDGLKKIIDRTSLNNKDQSDIMSYESQVKEIVSKWIFVKKNWEEQCCYETIMFNVMVKFELQSPP